MRYLALALLTFFLPIAASAASLSLAPQSVSVAAGQSFTLAVIANPASSTITSIRANISYDPSLVEQAWFTFAPGWLVISEPGYDVVDKVNGIVIKTAGYPGGITRPTQLGVITFKAKVRGKAVILIAGDTIMLDSNNANQFSGTSGAAIVQIIGGRQSLAPAAPAAGAATSSLTAAAALAPTQHLFPALFAALKHFLRPY